MMIKTLKDIATLSEKDCDLVISELQSANPERMLNILSRVTAAGCLDTKEDRAFISKSKCLRLVIQTYLRTQLRRKDGAYAK